MGKWSHYRGKYPARTVSLEQHRKVYEDLTEEELEYLVVGLDKEKREIKDKKLKNQLLLDAATEVLLDKWEHNGDTHQVKREALGMLSRVDDLFVKVSDMDSFKAWAGRKGMGNIVKEQVNTNSLTAVVKDILTDGDPVPEGVEIYTKSRIRTTQPKTEESV